MNNSISRRHFIKLAGLVSVGFSGLQMYACNPALAGSGSKKAGFGHLRPDPHKIINLPKGFSYKIISRQGEIMNDGFFIAGET